MEVSYRTYVVLNRIIFDFWRGTKLRELENGGGVHIAQTNRHKPKGGEMKMKIALVVRALLCQTMLVMPAVAAAFGPTRLLVGGKRTGKEDAVDSASAPRRMSAKLHAAASAATPPTQQRRQLEAILFDCDGVLADTERDGHRISFNLAFKNNGIDDEWSEERYGKLLEVGGGKERMTAHWVSRSMLLSEPQLQHHTNTMHAFIHQSSHVLIF